MVNEVKQPGKRDDERTAAARPQVIPTPPERFARDVHARLDRLEAEFDALREQLGALARGAA